eukprot:5575206-Amphidinium_carterae.1
MALAAAPGLWNFVPSVFSTSESLPSTSVQVNECYCYCSLYSYGYSGYYSVGYGAPTGMAPTSTSWPSSLLWLSQWNGPVFRSWSVAIVILLVCCRHLLAAFVLGVLGHLRQFLVGVVADCGDLQLILARGLCDVLLVACKRTGPFKRTLRRRMLAFRRRFVAHDVQEEDDLLVGVASDDGTVYRPLTAI